MKKIEPFLKHILDVIDKIERFTSDMDYVDFEKDEKTHESVIRQLEVIGEATTHLEDDFRSKYPQIPWMTIVAMRNYLIHEYWDVNLEDVWQTVVGDIPDLKRLVREILDKVE